MTRKRDLRDEIARLKQTVVELQVSIHNRDARARLNAPLKRQHMVRYLDYDQHAIDYLNERIDLTHPPGRYVLLNDLRNVAGRDGCTDLAAYFDWLLDAEPCYADPFARRPRVSTGSSSSALHPSDPTLQAP